MSIFSNKLIIKIIITKFSILFAKILIKIINPMPYAVGKRQFKKRPGHCCPAFSRVVLC